MTSKIIQFNIYGFKQMPFVQVHNSHNIVVLTILPHTPTDPPFLFTLHLYNNIVMMGFHVADILF